MYYGENRFYYRYFWEVSEIFVLLRDFYDIENEIFVSVWKCMLLEMGL